MGSYHAFMGEGSRLLACNRLAISHCPSAHALFLTRQPFYRLAFPHKYKIKANAHNDTEKPTSKTLDTLQKSLYSSSNHAPAAPPLLNQQNEEQQIDVLSSAAVQLEKQPQNGSARGKIEKKSIEKSEDQQRDVLYSAEAQREKQHQNGSVRGKTEKNSIVITKPSAVFLLLTRFRRNSVKFLASFPLAIGELAVIAFLCAIGTLIEQGQSKEFYIQKFSEDWAFGIFNSEWVLKLCLDHVYTAPYFLGLLICLAASLMACTSSRQLPLVKVARRWKFFSSVASISKLEFHETLQRARLDDLGTLLVGDNYQVFVKGPALYAFKGLAGRFAPIGVHAALLLIMGGATYSAIGGYHGSVMVPQGLNFIVGEVMYPNGVLAQPPNTFDTEVHVNKFFIETYPNGQVSQFHTDLSLNNLRGQEVSRKVVSVNDPLRYGGFTMYQTDWGISTFQVHVDGEGPFNLVAAPLQTGDNKLFGTFLPVGDKGLTNAKGISMLARDLQSVVIYDSSGAFVGVRRSGSERPITVDGVTIVIDEVIGSTGLEMKLDPGVPLVYAGFGALMLTTVVSYFSHLQVWALQVGDSVIVGGKSNRQKVDFEKELEKLLNLVPEIVKVNKTENVSKA